ncbi:MAG: hypothetical protein H7A45_10145 [Verrucomicrobiales bacterium]|nr:hypothetical protein [Verrucomicrobiales bacterium]
MAGSLMSVPARRVGSGATPSSRTPRAYAGKRTDVKPGPRAEAARGSSTPNPIDESRCELRAKAIRPDHLSDFMNAACPPAKLWNSGPGLRSTLFAATASAVTIQ